MVPATTRPCMPVESGSPPLMRHVLTTTSSCSKPNRVTALWITGWVAFGRDNTTDYSRRAITYALYGDDARFADIPPSRGIEDTRELSLSSGDPFAPDHPLVPRIWPNSIVMTGRDRHLGNTRRVRRSSLLGVRRRSGRFPQPCDVYAVLQAYDQNVSARREQIKAQQGRCPASVPQ